MTDPHVHPTTTDASAPVESDEHSLTVGPDGPVLLQDHYLIEQMANFNRERIPERQPHAKGGSAFGYFEVAAGRLNTCVGDQADQDDAADAELSELQV
jgi:catalase